MSSSEQIDFLNHTISLCADHLNDVVVIHCESHCISRVTYPHNFDHFTKLNEAKILVWSRYLKARRVELESFIQKNFE